MDRRQESWWSALGRGARPAAFLPTIDRKSTRLNSSHANISYAVFCLKKKNYMNLSASGRKVEVPFWSQLALSTNLKPGELLDEAYLRRLAYKVLIPDPTWEMWCRIFE